MLVLGGWRRELTKGAVGTAVPPPRWHFPHYARSCAMGKGTFCTATLRGTAVSSFGNAQLLARDRKGREGVEPQTPRIPPTKRCLGELCQREKRLV